MLDGVQRVIHRINDIEKRFNTAQTPVVNFSDILKSTEQSDSANTKNSGAGDVLKMLHVAANKYGVDPKLAVAVAKAESDLSPDAVSPVGATGVMQLMPDTARTLGVRNINDTRENIDGGVRYLKMMIDTFDGDITKAVAAYNAGPNAVKSYNGVPPYSETKAYVSKVLATYK